MQLIGYLDSKNDCKTYLIYISILLERDDDDGERVKKIYFNYIMRCTRFPESLPREKEREMKIGHKTTMERINRDFTGDEIDVGTYETNEICKSSFINHFLFLFLYYKIIFFFFLEKYSSSNFHGNLMKF